MVMYLLFEKNILNNVKYDLLTVMYNIIDISKCDILKYDLNVNYTKKSEIY